MKKLFLLTLAMLFAFAMPVQASEASGDYRPGYLIGSGSGDVIGPMLPTGDKSIKSERRFGSQLEAAEFYSENHTMTAMISDDSVNAGMPNAQGAMHEVGWRVSTTASE